MGWVGWKVRGALGLCLGRVSPSEEGSKERGSDGGLRLRCPQGSMWPGKARRELTPALQLQLLLRL